MQNLKRNPSGLSKNIESIKKNESPKGFKRMNAFVEKPAEEFTFENPYKILRKGEKYRQLNR